MSERRAARGDSEATRSADGGRSGSEGLVVRDKRKIKLTAAKARPDGEPDGSGAGSTEQLESSAESTAEPTGKPTGAEPAAAAGGVTVEEPAGGGPASTGADAGTEAGEPGVEGGAEAEAAEAVTAEPPAGPAPEPVAEPIAVDGPTASASAPALGAELEALRSELEERTNDLQRITAEYANYRKRVDRDRGLVVEQATAGVLATLLPILDDLDRAREHGDLTGPFGAVAEQLTTGLGKFGLAPFGEQGDPFDPTRHEAVAHQTSPDVTEPTCIDVMRRGYLLGDRLLRPALVAVADPE